MLSMSSRIRRARALAAISQSELARRIGVRRSAVTQWEHPSGTTPSVTHLAQIACETAVFFEWLATGRGPVRPEQDPHNAALSSVGNPHDELEAHVLVNLRQMPSKRRELVVQLIEQLSR